jgi:hypothetical protein
MMSNHHGLLGIAGKARPRSGVGVGPHVGLFPRRAASAPGEEHPDIAMISDHGDIGIMCRDVLIAWSTEPTQMRPTLSTLVDGSRQRFGRLSC